MATAEVKKWAEEADHTVGILQVQLDAAGAELKKLEAEVVLAKSEVIVTEMRVRVDVVVTRSEMARAKVEAEESRKEGYEVALSHV